MHPVIGIECECNSSKNKASPPTASSVGNESVTGTPTAADNRSTCEQTCTITVQGFEKQFKATYMKGSTVPVVGGIIEVYYHPEKREETATLKTSPYGMLAAITGLLCLSQVASIFLSA